MNKLNKILLQSEKNEHINVNFFLNFALEDYIQGKNNKINDSP